MKLKAVLIVLVFAMVGVACGKRTEYVMGQKGDKGDTGEAGSDGAGCTAIEVAPSSLYPNGGVAILCGTDNVVVKNGTPGADGAAGAPGTDAIVQIIDPCGDAPGIYDEVILKLSNGTLLASFSDNANGNNTRFSVLTAGNYTTTDGSNCHFTVNANGTIQ